MTVSLLTPSVGEVVLLLVFFTGVLLMNVVTYLASVLYSWAYIYAQAKHGRIVQGTSFITFRILAHGFAVIGIWVLLGELYRFELDPASSVLTAPPTSWIYIMYIVTMFTWFLSQLLSPVVFFSIGLGAKLLSIPIIWSYIPALSMIFMTVTSGVLLLRSMWWLIPAVVLEVYTTVFVTMFFGGNWDHLRKFTYRRSANCSNLDVKSNNNNNMLSTESPFTGNSHAPFDRNPEYTYPIGNVNDGRSSFDD